MLIGGTKFLYLKLLFIIPERYSWKGELLLGEQWGLIMANTFKIEDVYDDVYGRQCWLCWKSPEKGTAAHNQLHLHVIGYQNQRPLSVMQPDYLTTLKIAQCEPKKKPHCRRQCYV